MLFGENGIITRAQESAFRTEMAEIKEAVNLKESECRINNKLITDVFTEQITMEEIEKWDIDLKVEIIYWGQYEVGINKLTKEYVKEHWKEILKSKNGETNKIDNLYYIDPLNAKGEPVEGGTLPSNYVPHPAFNESTEGIWASKYEPIEK